MKILQTGIHTFPFRIVQRSSGDRKYVTLQPHNCKPWPIFWRLNHSEACIAGVLKARKRGFGAREKREGCARARERNLLSSPSRTREFSSPSLSNACHADQPFGFRGRTNHSVSMATLLINEGQICVLKITRFLRETVRIPAVWQHIAPWSTEAVHNTKVQDPKPPVYNCRCFLSFLEAALEIAFAPWMDMVLKYTFTHHPRWGPVEWR